MHAKSCLIGIIIFLSFHHGFAIKKVVEVDSVNERYRLQASNSSLEIDENGYILFTPLNEDLPNIVSKNKHWWSLVLWEPSDIVLKYPAAFPEGGEKTLITAEGQVPEISASKTEIRLVYPQLKHENESYEVEITYIIKLIDDAFHFVGSIKNNEDGRVVSTLDYPKLEGLTSPDEKYTVYWPDGLGLRFEDPELFGSRTLNYPSGRSTMQWFSINNTEGGIYVGSHDAERLSKHIQASYQKENQTFHLSLTQYPFCKAGETTEVVPLVIKSYEGTWYTAAKYYREFFDSQIDRVYMPDWVKYSSGWLLTILKQQNGYVMWNYSDLEEVYKIADEWNLDVIGLFGWAHGGHDYLYPDYYPDPLMGGRETLQRMLKQAKEYGKRTILYANGQLIDTSTDFYRYQGNNVISQNEWGRPNIQAIRKYNSATPVTFAQGCNGSAVWFQRMLDLAMQANDLGADGILYDQLGVIGPNFCYSNFHTHTNPATAFSTSRYDLLDSIAKHMQQINPDFVVMTEGLIDALMESVPFNHGWGIGFNIDNFPLINEGDLFPELFRYTFPEQVLTQRHSTPMQDRRYANFICVYGLRHELESRYEEDVDYLKYGKIPEDDAYADPTYYTPNVSLMQSVSPEEAKSYMHALIDFERKHKDLFWEGRFIDEENITIKGNNIVGKGFMNGDRIGVVLWNNSDSPQKAAVEVSGYKLIKTEAPEDNQSNTNGLIPPQSVRLMIWKKDQ